VIIQQQFCRELIVVIRMNLANKLKFVFKPRAA
jgi:hypothetical protein